MAMRRAPPAARQRVALAFLVRPAAFGALLASTAPGISTPAHAAPPLLVDGHVSPAFLTKSRSPAIGHGAKPMARLGVRGELRPRLEVGGALTGLVDASAHYRVLGALAHGRFALWQRPTFSLGGALALGAGLDADILHSDLSADATVLPYGFLALDARWSLGPVRLGVEAGWENLSILRLGLLAAYRFGGSP
jgi:hypothetical protein